ncbi:hypothetical protein C7H19_23930 [Aphanothece hegewaldii CCALA 016]|uniref:Flagellar assembly protein H n=1 Tax=Aphanothece hegewaldii CCALA 016 TaxID=2107694 RepID=A0A2T1LR47_9CHRO|nr:hypothetical protein [Aphanothece hegewaldii]PSF30449.1 hypothetical protein C7H19_23930 [Aphanothece hegewaldii CCALA 016]
MTRQPHDQFAKEYLEELLSPIGKVETSRDVRSEVQEIDVWFVPTNSPSLYAQNLGLLNQMAATSCLFEPYRNAPTESEIRSCLLKLYTVHGELLRKAKREKQSLSEVELPFLWILSPSCSVRIKEGFGARLNEKENWVEGVYFLHDFLKTALVAINQLPVTPDTLWLRVLGKGGTQRQAVEELANLPENHPFRDNLLEILASWRKTLELKDNKSEEERELIMNLSPAYIEQRELWRLEGKLEGKIEGKIEGNFEGQSLMVASLLEERFGFLDEELSNLIPTLMQLPLPERTRLLLQIANLSREDLIARLEGSSN